uniref:Phosphoglycerate dehydrogenase n=1 Tax=Percolomonas cosmopolitus TaxID=63605 RepID=A0A7S1KT80_9EUKA|mmetsp:Transcript_7445/g.27876  ORF Transcript_7445/g.27876 Transcript_7445/m.27876 type:complete len:695 (+) Transcript_7445:1735-3819(+)
MSSTLEKFFDRFLQRNKKGNDFDTRDLSRNEGTSSEQAMRSNATGAGVVPTGSRSNAHNHLNDHPPRRHRYRAPSLQQHLSTRVQEATEETIVVYTHKVFDHEPQLERRIIEKKADRAYPLLVVNSEKDLLLVRHPVALLVWHDVELKHPEIINHLSDRGLKCIVRVGSGYEHIDHERCAMKGIVVSSLPSFGVDEMADSTLCMILNLLRGTHRIATRVRNENRFLTTTEFGICRRVRGTHLGLIGLGAVGTSVALRAKAFGMKVSFYDPYIPEGFEKSLHLHRAHSVIDLLQHSDIVSLHAGINGETRHLISKSSMKYMKKGSYLINNGRGGLVEEEAVIEALHSGHLAGVALDVIDNEIHYDGRWRDVPNLILTAHSSYFSHKSFEEMRKNSIMETVRILRGGMNKAKYSINRALFDRFKRFKTKRHKTNFVPDEDVRSESRREIAQSPPLVSPRDFPRPSETFSDAQPGFHGRGDIFHPSTTEGAVPRVLTEPNLIEQDRVPAPAPGANNWLPRTDNGQEPDLSPRYRADEQVVVRPDFYSHPHLVRRKEEVPEWKSIPEDAHVRVVEEVSGNVLQQGDVEDISPQSLPDCHTHHSGSPSGSVNDRALRGDDSNSRSQETTAYVDDDDRSRESPTGDSFCSEYSLTDGGHSWSPNSLTLGSKASELTPLSTTYSSVFDSRDAESAEYDRDQ